MPRQPLVRTPVVPAVAVLLARPELVGRLEVLDRWRQAMERRGLAGGTIRHELAVVFHWWDHVGDPWRAGRRDVEAFVDGLDVQAPRRYYVICYLHRFYVWARREGLARSDPTELVERPRLPHRLPRPIADTDLAIAVATSTGSMHTAILLAATSGLRACELARLRWDDVSTTTVRVVGKGNRERVVPLHPAARAALEELDRADDWVLPWREAVGSRGIGQRVSKAVNDFLHGSGSRATCHQLRHWFATAALNASGDLRAVQELLGHASPTTTAIYTKLDMRRLGPIVTSISVPGLDVSCGRKRRVMVNRRRRLAET